MAVETLDRPRASEPAEELHAGEHRLSHADEARRAVDELLRHLDIEVRQADARVDGE